MNQDEPEAFRHRTKRYALGVISFSVQLPSSRLAQVLGGQMLRSGTSVGAHYREACRARSNAEFISKMEGALQELDETGYWLELLIESSTCASETARELVRETDELIRIFVTIVKKRKDEK